MTHKQAFISVIVVTLLMLLPFPLCEYNIISKLFGIIMQIISVVLAAVLILYSDYLHDKK